MKVTVARCVIIAVFILVLRWQGAETWEASAASVLLAYLILPNRPVA